MNLLSCPACHTQFDVTGVTDHEFRCPCGESVRVESPVPVDAEIRRCASCGASVGTDAARCDYCGSAIVRAAGPLALVCPECYARNGEKALFCASCGVRFNPQPVGASVTPLDCPCCATAMKPRTIGGVVAQECAACHGLWAPGESFDKLVRRAVRAERESYHGESARAAGGAANGSFQGDVVYRRCPVCDGLMQRKNFGRRSGVIVDWCGLHGTWLDADELEQVASFIAAGGLERGRDDARRDAGRDERWMMKQRADRLKRSAAIGKGAPSVAASGTIGDLLRGLLGR